MRGEAERHTPLQSTKILLAEDNPTNQMVAMQMLESLGAEVTLAVDGAEALEILQREAFDVALIDIEMPRISGIELIRRLRSMQGDVAAMPLIALTAYVMREHRIAIEEAGADAIIAKPILSIEQFGADILEHLGASGAAPGSIPQQSLEFAADSQPAKMDLDVFDGLKNAFAPEKFVELTEKIRSDISSAKQQIGEACETGNLEQLRSSTHILISVAGVIGASRLQELAQCLNSAGHHADNDTIARDGPELGVEAARVLAFVGNSLSE